MLDGECLARFGEVEHIKDDGFGASILATMDRAYYLDQGLAFVERALLAVLADDRQVTLLDDAIVDSRMVMPAGHGADGKCHL